MNRVSQSENRQQQVGQNLRKNIEKKRKKGEKRLPNGLFLLVADPNILLHHRLEQRLLLVDAQNQ